MARRSPTNARYQKYQEPPGKTRKSAAAAKPSRKAVNPNAPRPGGSAKGSRARIDPQTPEFKALRSRWWAGLGAGVVLVAISWGIRLLDRPGAALSARFTIGTMNMSYAGVLSSLMLGLAYASMFYALYIDFARMRPMRQSYAASPSGEKNAKPSKKDTSNT